MVIIGLILIALAWIVQLLLENSRTKIHPAFLNLYALGTLLLVIDAFLNHQTIIAYLNLASFSIALLVLYRTVTKK
ncbi:MAG: hypothetical protein COU27_01830 [Candidatus Levybacteria bacterium CG10_big_fil_rev_8_21_14_0_10_36_7]|nr:MAG: hypothetical protein COU27_01830 [Candidatus Levybacteria bacterium CG10_big_fil_rev_8_21_14_0_10_36_7]